MKEISLDDLLAGRSNKTASINHSARVSAPVMPRSTNLTSSCLHCLIRLIVRCLHCCNCAFVHVGNIAYFANLNIFCTVSLLQTLDNVHNCCKRAPHRRSPRLSKEHFLPHKAQFIRREMRLPRGQATKTNKLFADFFLPYVGDKTIGYCR